MSITGKQGALKKERKPADMTKRNEHVAARIARSRQLFLIAYKENMGNISLACDAVNINRNTFYAWMKQSKEFNALIRERDDAIVDIGESALKRNVTRGKEASVFFLLCNKRPDRWRSINKVEYSIDDESKKKIDRGLDVLSQLLTGNKGGDGGKKRVR